jgi:hypothetical protein
MRAPIAGVGLPLTRVWAGRSATPPLWLPTGGVTAHRRAILEKRNFLIQLIRIAGTRRGHFPPVFTEAPLAGQRVARVWRQGRV